MEMKRVVKTFEVDFQCPKCAEGRLRPSGIAFMTYPLKYPHRCNKCEYEEVFRVQYPYIKHE